MGAWHCVPSVQAAEFLYHLTIGSFSAVLGALSGYPLDLIKTRIMNQRLQSWYRTMQTSYYSDNVDCLRKVVRYEGVAGLYRGGFHVPWWRFKV